MTIDMHMLSFQNKKLEVTIKKVIGIIILCLILVAFVICLLLPKEEPKTESTDLFVYSYIENVELPLINSTDQIINHTAYSLQYNEQHEQADWVAYMLTSDELTGSAKRKDNFRPDPMVTTGSAELQDYKKSGYDRGHLAPAADMDWSEEVMSESFYMSNMSPQKPGFNRGVWKRLEEQVRDWANKFDTLYVVTGPVLEDGLPTIGENEVSIPNQYYKALLVYKSNVQTAVGFLLDNDSSSQELQTFAITIDSLERITSIDFFPKLPDKLETKIEAVINNTDWIK